MKKKLSLPAGLHCGFVIVLVMFGMFIGCSAQASLWKIDKAGSILVRDRGSDAWTPIPGSLTQVEQGENGVVWGINKNNDVYIRDGISTTQPYGTKWTKIGGVALKQITVGCDGNVRGVSPAGEIYFRDGISAQKPKGTAWSKIDGSVQEIAVGGAVLASEIAYIGNRLPENSIVAIKCVENDAYLTLDEELGTNQVVARAENYISRNALFQVMKRAPNWVGFKNLGNNCSVQALTATSKIVRAYGQKFAGVNDVSEHFNLEDETLLKCQSTGAYIGSTDKGILIPDTPAESAATFDFYILIYPDQDIDLNDIHAIEERAQAIMDVQEKVKKVGIEAVAGNVRKNALDKLKAEDTED